MRRILIEIPGAPLLAALAAGWLLWCGACALRLLRRDKDSAHLLDAGLFLGGAGLLLKFLVWDARLERIPIYAFGIMVLFGFLAALRLARRLSLREGLDDDVVHGAAVAAILSGLFGARLLYYFQFYNEGEPSFAQRPWWAILEVWEGGVVFYGGLILAIPVVLSYVYKRGAPLARFADVAVAAIPLGHALGRIGCFLNGCCWGAVTTLPWAITYPPGPYAFAEHERAGYRIVLPETLRGSFDPGGSPAEPPRSAADLGLYFRIQRFLAGKASLPVHPVQLYESAGLLLLSAFLVAHLLRFRRKPGETAALYALGYGVLRFLLEMLRGDTPYQNRIISTRLTISQSISVLLVIGGALAWTYLSFFTPPEAPGAKPPAPKKSR